MSKIKDLLARAISLASEQPMSYKEVIELLDGIDTCKVKIWLEEGAKLPEYAHKEDACMYNIGMTNINPDVNIITNNVDISFIISLSITSLIISPPL